MTLAPEFVGHEEARVRQARLTALPFTFPGAPDIWRKPGLQLMTAGAALLARRRPPPPPARSGRPSTWSRSAPTCHRGCS